MKRAIGLTIAAILIVIAFLSVRGTLPIIPIYGNSMEPTLHSGGLLVIDSSIDPKEIQIGDVIVYNVPKMVRDAYNYPPTVAHRVVAVYTTPSLGYRTKGDNTGEDPFTIRPQDIRGTVGKQIPYMGLPLLFFQSTQGLIFAIIAIALLALFLYGKEIGKGGSWLHRGIFSPVINEEKRVNRVLTSKIESTEKKLNTTEQALVQFSAAIAEYAKHLASHTSAIQGLSEASHELKKGAAEQNRVLAALLDNIVDNNQKEIPLTKKAEASAKAARPAAKKAYKVIEKPKATEPNYHKALKDGTVKYTKKH